MAGEEEYGLPQRHPRPKGRYDESGQRGRHLAKSVCANNGQEVDDEHCEQMLEREHRPRSCDDSTRRCDSQAGRDFRKGHEGYNSIPSLAVVFNLCDRRFDTRSGRMTWHPKKK